MTGTRILELLFTIRVQWRFCPRTEVLSGAESCHSAAKITRDKSESAKPEKSGSHTLRARPTGNPPYHAGIPYKIQKFSCLQPRYSEKLVLP